MHWRDGDVPRRQLLQPDSEETAGTAGVQGEGGVQVVCPGEAGLQDPGGEETL